MGNTLTMRASDRDRQDAVDLLQGAVEDGRLTMNEYMDRMGRAYQAVTFADLAPLLADLPARESGAVRATGLVSAAGAAAAEAPASDGRTPQCRRAGFADLPAILRVFWGIWFTAVSINVVVWLLVTVTSGQLAYPWPLWVAGPYGAALFAISAAVSQSRRHRRLLPTRRAGTPVVPAKS
jgi:hypothetical protein